MKIVTSLNNYTANRSKVSPLTNVYGIGRSILAGGLFLTLLVNDIHTLFPTSSTLEMRQMSVVAEFSIFNLLSGQLWLAKLLSMAVLFLVVIGWRPRFTGVFHWWITFSFFAACTIIDGGHQIAIVLAVLLVPLTLLDGRKWHWDMGNESQEVSQRLKNLTAWGFVFLLRLQVAFIYLHAAVAKFSVKEWIDGTAVYYWSTHHYHGFSPLLKSMMLPLLANPVFIACITWGTMILELALFMALLLDRNDKRRKTLLVLGLLFHLAILIIHGLVSFYFSMAAALVFYLYPMDQAMNFDPKTYFLNLFKFRSSKPKNKPVDEQILGQTSLSNI